MVILTSYLWVSLAGNEREFLFEQPWGVCMCERDKRREVSLSIVGDQVGR